MLRRGAGLLLAAALLGCAPLAHTPDGTAPATAGEAAVTRLPAEAGGFRLAGPAQPDRTPGVREGMIARYEGRWGFATTYLFTREAAAVEEGPDSRQARQELVTAAAASLIAATQNGAPRPAREAAVTFQQGNAPALRCLLFERSLQSGLMTDFVCVTGVGGRLFKLRVTARHTAENREELVVAVGQLSTALIAGAGSRPDGSPPRVPGLRYTALDTVPDAG
ncbi:hypothetical protein [Roseomonas sp. BN140053]|uniref:hypothetical protein n=1 Tax=Roseomonas sp. BN140053 TaxID=3391898 RepID=UPI0039EBB6D8